MRKPLACLLAVLTLFTSIGAAAKTQFGYTLPLDSGTVLQNNADRNISPQTTALRHTPITGESPVTGLPWQGKYLPMLVQISNATGMIKSKGGTVKAAGIGNRAPWGLQYADVLYEMLLGVTGETRFSALFSDCFSQGQPKAGVGPVRSTRIGQLQLREEWQSGFAYSGDFFISPGVRDQQIAEQLSVAGTLGQGILFNVLSKRFSELKVRAVGVKAPDNLSVDIIGLRDLIPDSFLSQPRPFQFADQPPYENGYALATIVNLDWGNPETVSHFVYDQVHNVYQRYCGPGTKASRWTPFQSLASATDRSEENQFSLTFANLIIQRVPYEHDETIWFMPNIRSIGKGNADVFIGGRYIPGYWVRTSLSEPTIYYDDRGSELVLCRGKTFIAQFPPEALCTFAGAASD